MKGKFSFRKKKILKRWKLCFMFPFTSSAITRVPTGYKLLE